MRLALAQLGIDPGKVDANVEAALEAVEAGAAAGADLVVLPEVFNVGYFSFDLYSRAAEPVTGETIGRLADAAADHGVAVLAGSIVEDLAASAAAGVDVPASEGLANATVFLDDGGDRLGVYRKQHLFGYGSAEQELLTPGESLAVAEYGDQVFGLTTCYDLRFPELYRRLVEAGVTCTLVPSAWPYPRVEHWRLLPRARAVENLMYIAAVNGVATFEDAELVGRSALYDPWGTVVTGAGDDPAVLTGEVDRDRVDEVREEFPALADRRR